MSKFSFGNAVMTRGIGSTIAENEQFAKEIMALMRRYVGCDWGDMCKEDKALNDSAVETGNDRILAAYNTSQGKVYIITERDRSYTTILFASEY